MDASHIVGLVIALLVVTGTVTGIGAMFSLGRQASYDD